MENIDQSLRNAQIQAHANQRIQAQNVKQASDHVIDFQEQLRRERQKIKEKIAFKSTNPMNVFNMLQDLRHLIILDFRSQEEFDKRHVRKAIRVGLDNYKEIIASLIVSLTAKNEEIKLDSGAQSKEAISNLSNQPNLNGKSFKSQYPNDDLKRVLFILPESSQENKIIIDEVTKDVQALSDQIFEVTQERISKMFYLKDFTDFEKKYPLLCVPNPCHNEFQAVISQSRFPSEVKKDLVYMGNLTNVLGKDNAQLKMLGIKSIIHFTPQRFDQLETEFDCTHYKVENFNKDMDEISFQQIAEEVIATFDKPDKRPVFIFCVNGHLAAALAIKIVMETNKIFTKELAVAYVMNKRYEIKDMPSWLYQMIR